MRKVRQTLILVLTGILVSLIVFYSYYVNVLSQPGYRYYYAYSITAQAPMYATAIDVVGGNKIVMTGTINIEETSNAYLILADSNGSIIWSKTLYIKDKEYGLDVKALGDNDYVAVFTHLSKQKNRLIVARIVGQTITWALDFGTDASPPCSVSAGGGAIYLVFHHYANHSIKLPVLVKLDVDGRVE